MSKKVEVEKLGPGTFPEDVDYYEAHPEGFHVYSWCPTPDGTGPAEQVHLHIALAFGRVIVRFKGPDTLSALIDALVDHRKDVWGK